MKAPLGSWACIHSRKNLHIGEKNWSIFSMKVSPRIRISNLKFLRGWPLFCALAIFCNTNADFSFSFYSNLERQKIGRIIRFSYIKDKFIASSGCVRLIFGSKEWLLFRRFNKPPSPIIKCHKIQ